MVSDARLEEFLRNARQNWGYAAGVEKIPGTIPGEKAFPPYVEESDGEKLSLIDRYYGKRGSGGSKVILHNDTPILLAQYHGGERTTVHNQEVAAINDFLKQALSQVDNARLPDGAPYIPRLLHESTEFGYAALGRGNIWNLVWVEIIFKKPSPIPHIIKMRRGGEIFEDFLVLNRFDEQDESIVFFHTLTHQRLH